MLNHEAIRKAYPNAKTIDDGAGAFDKEGNHIQRDQAKVDAAAILVAQEQALASAQRNRATAYRNEADPLFFKAQRGEATIEEWQLKVAEIRSLYPYPNEEVQP